MPRLHSIFSFTAVTAALLFVLSGCNTQSHLGGDDSGVGTDGGGGEACGSVTCGDGLVCCNASCGICTEPGVGCIALACEDGGTPPPTDGGPGEACGPVTCGPGTVCCGDPSCGRCVEPGLTCPAIACADAGPPPGTPCGGFGSDECGEGMFCEHGPGSGCGFDDGTGTCQPMPTGCTRDCPGVCGCDGATYCNACNAASVGVSVMHEGTCDGPAICAPMDAAGDGLCDLSFGYAWNGAECVGLGGCTCVGADCGSLTSLEACQAAHVECPSVIVPGPSCGGFSGDCGPGEYCDYRDGSFCGGDDSLGVCVRRADPGCIEIYSPVCGCDGVTYDNSCFASAAGQDFQYTGVCSSP